AASVGGETLGARLNENERCAAARRVMARQCGEILARIHAMAVEDFPFLIEQDAAAELQVYRDIWDSFDHPQPAIELGFRWVGERAPKPARRCLVHGDFRNGNFIVGPDGIRAVLDWEIAHVGDPMADLGWLCVRTWRFGGGPAVGGFGDRDELFEAYERAAGARIDPEAVFFWEVFGCLKWSVMCMMKGQRHLRDRPRSLEQLAIGLPPQGGAAARPPRPAARPALRCRRVDRRRRSSSRPSASSSSATSCPCCPPTRGSSAGSPSTCSP